VVADSLSSDAHCEQDYLANAVGYEQYVAGTVAVVLLFVGLVL